MNHPHRSKVQRVKSYFYHQKRARDFLIANLINLVWRYENRFMNFDLFFKSFFFQRGEKIHVRKDHNIPIQRKFILEITMQGERLRIDRSCPKITDISMPIISADFIAFNITTFQICFSIKS